MRAAVEVSAVDDRVAVARLGFVKGVHPVILRRFAPASADRLSLPRMISSTEADVCQICGEFVGLSSHWHCPHCGEVSGIFGHATLLGDYACEANPEKAKLVREAWSGSSE
jgi:predicted RNA-binding Zn-ribbon protein involved in translation (DUF1610 family)